MAEAANFLKLSTDVLKRNVDEGCLEAYEGNLFHIVDLRKFVLENHGQIRYPITAWSDFRQQRIWIGWEINGQDHVDSGFLDDEDLYEVMTATEDPDVQWAE